MKTRADIPVRRADYPLAGTNADKVLEAIKGEPGISTNQIIKQTSLNPAVVRKCLANLIERGRVTDNPTSHGYHSYSAVAPKSI